MGFEDFFNPAQEISALKVEIEDLKTELDEYKGMSNIILKQRQDLSYLLKESACFIHEFEDAMPEEDFKKCTAAGHKKYEDWVKKEFELDQVKVEATIQP